ncbi:MAG: hypothetical protein V9E83_08015 [Baekduia sp.]
MRARPYAGTLSAVVLAVVYVLWEPLSADLAAQLFRADLYRDHGFAIWSPYWYGGHHLPSYSLLSPPLMAIAGPQAAGAVALVAGTFAFERIAGGRAFASVWFAVAFATTGLVTGRITFAIGAALALGAVALASAGPRWARAAAPVVAALTGLASPVAAALLVLAMAVWASTDRRMRTIAGVVALSALAPAAALLLAFPNGGDFPFALTSFLPTLAACVVLWLALPQEQTLLRRAVLAIGLLVLISGVVSSPMGGNATRPATLLAGSIAVLGLWPAHRRRLLWLAPVLVYWQLYPAFDDWRQARDDPSTEAAFYAPLKAELARLTGGAPARIEVPFTDNHWESYRLPGDNLMLARGWERQLDRKRNALFYEGRLTHAAYANWLRENAVAYVALPAAPLDYSAAREAELIRERPRYLREVWRNGDWRLFRVVAALPLADGGRVIHVGPDRLVIDARRPGQVLVRFSHTRYFDASDSGGWMVVHATRPGRIELR